MKTLKLYSLNRELLNRQFDGFEGSISEPYIKVNRRHTIRYEYSRRVEEIQLEIKKLQLELKALKKREEEDGSAEVISESNILTITPQTSVWEDSQVEFLNTLLDSLDL
ncbi:MAG: hypothetical protein ACO3YX_08015 [Candidatus Nanopelagicaceae bacterium]